jgi:hypothetical protein
MGHETRNYHLEMSGEPTDSYGMNRAEKPKILQIFTSTIETQHRRMRKSLHEIHSAMNTMNRWMNSYYMYNVFYYPSIKSEFDIFSLSLGTVSLLVFSSVKDDRISILIQSTILLLFAQLTLIH